MVLGGDLPTASRRFPDSVAHWCSSDSNWDTGRAHRAIVEDRHRLRTSLSRLLFRYSSGRLTAQAVIAVSSIFSHLRGPFSRCWAALPNSDFLHEFESRIFRAGWERSEWKISSASDLPSSWPSAYGPWSLVTIGTQAFSTHPPSLQTLAISLLVSPSIRISEATTTPFSTEFAVSKLE